MVSNVEPERRRRKYPGGVLRALGTVPSCKRLLYVHPPPARRPRPAGETFYQGAQRAGQTARTMLAWFLLPRSRHLAARATSPGCGSAPA